MTQQAVFNMIDSMGFPNAYYQFPSDTEQEPPFVVFFFSSRDDLYADNANYRPIGVLSVELYTAEKDLSSESAVEAVLASNGLTYSKEEAYIDSESMWQISYEMEVIYDG